MKTSSSVSVTASLQDSKKRSDLQLIGSLAQTKSSLLCRTPNQKSFSVTSTSKNPESESTMVLPQGKEVHATGVKVVKQGTDDDKRSVQIMVDPIIIPEPKTKDIVNINNRSVLAGNKLKLPSVKSKLGGTNRSAKYLGRR